MVFSGLSGLQILISDCQLQSDCSPLEGRKVRELKASCLLAIPVNSNDIHWLSLNISFPTSEVLRTWHCLQCSHCNHCNHASLITSSRWWEESTEKEKWWPRQTHRFFFFSSFMCLSWLLILSESQKKKKSVCTISECFTGTFTNDFFQLWKGLLQGLTGKSRQVCKVVGNLYPVEIGIIMWPSCSWLSNNLPSSPFDLLEAT